MHINRPFRTMWCVIGAWLLLSACAQPVSPAPTASAQPSVMGSMSSPLTSPVARELVAVPVPAAGKATVTGVIVSATTGAPYARTSIHLAEVYRQNGEAAYILNTASSPSTLTNDSGQFIAKDIPAREYVIVIGEPNASYAILNEPNGQAKVWNAEGGKVLDVGLQPVTLR